MTTETIRNVRLDGRITLLSPLSHIGESAGPDSFLAQDVIVGPDGRPVECFTYSGNAFRGHLRDLCMVYMTEKLQVRYQLPAFYLLFSGGTLANDQHIDVAAVRKVRGLFPALSLFGGSLGQQILPGKIKVGCMYPVAAETQRVLPEFMRRPDAPSWRFLTFDRSFVRTDDLKNLVLARYTRAPAKEENRGGKKKKNPQQMRYTVELVAAGTELYQRIELCDVTDLELGAFVSGLEELAKRPYIGGRSGSGCGLVRIEYFWRPAGAPAPEGEFAVVDPEFFAVRWDVAVEAKARYDQFLEDLRLRLLEAGEAEALGLLGPVSPAAPEGGGAGNEAAAY